MDKLMGLNLVINTSMISFTIFVLAMTVADGLHPHTSRKFACLFVARYYVAISCLLNFFVSVNSASGTASGNDYYVMIFFSVGYVGPDVASSSGLAKNFWADVCVFDIFAWL